MSAFFNESDTMPDAKDAEGYTLCLPSRNAVGGREFKLGNAEIKVPINVSVQVYAGPGLGF